MEIEHGLRRSWDRRKLFAKNGDVPHVCSLKPRSRKPVAHKIATQRRRGRTYDEFLVITAAAPDVRVVEMDSLMGRVGARSSCP